MDLNLAPWRRAPGLLFRRPTVAFALTASVLVATVPAAAAPAFLSSARDATLHHQLARDCWADTGLTVSATAYWNRAGTPQSPAPGQPAPGQTTPGLDLAQPGAGQSPPTGTGGAVGLETPEFRARRDEALAQASHGMPALGRPVRTHLTQLAVGPAVPAPQGDPTATSLLVSRTGAADHVRVVR